MKLIIALAIAATLPGCASRMLTDDAVFVKGYGWMPEAQAEQLESDTGKTLIATGRVRDLRTRRPVFGW